MRRDVLVREGFGASWPMVVEAARAGAAVVMSQMAASAKATATAPALRRSGVRIGREERPRPVLLAFPSAVACSCRAIRWRPQKGSEFRHVVLTRRRGRLATGSS